MPTYDVVISGQFWWTDEVEAATKEEAINKGKRALNDSLSMPSELSFDADEFAAEESK